MKKISLILLIMLTMMACTESYNSNNAVRQFNISFGKHKNVPFHFKEMVDTFYYVPLDDSILVGNVDEIKFVDSVFYLICKNEGRIICFDYSGHFLKTFNKTGHAKDEYVMMSDADISSDGSYHIFDCAQHRLLRYTSTGQFCSAINVKEAPRDFAVFSNGDYLFYTPVYYPGDYHDGLWQTDSNGIFKKQLVSPEEGFAYGGVHPTYLNKFSDDKYSLMGAEDSDNIYFATLDTAYTLYHLNFGMKIPDRIKCVSTTDYEKHKGEIYIKHMYMESSRWVMVQSTDFISQLCFIYDKKSDKEYHITSDKEVIQTEGFGGFYSFPLNDMWVFVLYPSEILQNDSLYKKIPNITEQSNPVLVIVKLTK